MTKAQMRRNVRRGAKLLDRVKPGWARQVKIRELDQRNGCRCVLGQLDDRDGYRTMSYEVGLEPYTAESERHGFFIRLVNLRDDDLYVVLDGLWAEEIRARRKPKVAA